MKIASLKNSRSFYGSTVFLRVDYNVPLQITAGGSVKVKEDYKITASLPTIRYLRRYGCRVVIASHLGDDPLKEGSRKRFYSTKILASKLSDKLGIKVKFINDCIGDKVHSRAGALKDGEVLMLENLRFYKGEKENSKDFAKKLAAAIKQNASSETSKKTARIKACYVNDAFSVSHRRHASVSSIKQYLPAFAGLLLENEIINLNKALKPKKPAVAVMGGAKISTKIRLIKKLQASYSNILIGGAMANNFFKAKGLEVGKSLVSDDDIELAKKIRSNKVILPIDCVVGSGASGKKIALKKIGEVSKKDAIYDIGPETLKLYAKYLNQAKTIIWNGPMGMFENKRFRTGSITIARLISTLSSGKAFGVVGGGETIEALKLAKDFHYVDWVSTGGGAMLAYLGGEEMPGLERLIK